MACVFPLAADQLIGASGEQLSFAIYWMMWGFVIAYHTQLLKGISSVYFGIVVEALSFLCISMMGFIFSYCKYLLTIVPQLSNPYKLIFRVLNYARIHKYPERRSALTYWEEDIPSRIDLGMSKYGGPFTVEEVEDVKTFFQLLPVISCAAGCYAGILIDCYNLLDGEGPFGNYKFEISCILLSQLILFALGIPLYHFLLYPLFYNYIPTMLNRIGVGLVLTLCSYGMYAVVGDLLVCNTLTNTTCILFHSEMFDISSNGVWWLTVPITIHNAGLLLSTITLFEFVCAQSPRPLCGLLTGFAIMSIVLNASIGYVIGPIVAIIIANAHCWFCSDLSFTIIVLVY